jgi:hypothetical protein
MKYDFENLFLTYGQETLIVSGHADFSVIKQDNLDRANFEQVKITDLHRVYDTPMELQGFTNADHKHIEQLAVNALNDDYELCSYLPIKK